MIGLGSDKNDDNNDDNDDTNDNNDDLDPPPSRSSLGRMGSSPPSSLCCHGTENMFGVLRTKIIRNWRDCYKTYKKVCQQ